MEIFTSLDFQDILFVPYSKTTILKKKLKKIIIQYTKKNIMKASRQTS